MINPHLPPLVHGVRLPMASFAATIEVEALLREYDVGAPSAQASAIAGHIARYIVDGATLQVGLGKVPDALLRLLTDRRNLKLHSGMLSDGAQILAEKGCLDAGFRHTACVGLGSQAFYAWLDGRDDFAIAGCDVTHDALRLASLAGLVAVNSAISVDLFGQANLEMLDGRMISGVGGAPDFARGASLAQGGLSIIALPSVGGKEQTSRIVPQLDTAISLPRYDIDVLVTEQGAADLRGLTIAARAMAIAAVAAPQHRGALEEAAHALQRRL